MAFLAGQRPPASVLDWMVDPPRAQLIATTAQTVPNNTWTTLQFNDEDFDSHSGHSLNPGSNHFYIVQEVPGIYEISGGLYWVQNGTGTRAIKFTKNSVDIRGSGNAVGAVSSPQTGVASRTLMVEMAIGDFLTMDVFQGSGGNLATYVDVEYVRPTFSIHCVVDYRLL